MSKLEQIDASRRAALTKLIQGSAFAVPVVASFAMSGMAPAQAQVSNSNIQAVPTLNEWGIGLLAAGVGAAAVVALNAKKKEA